MQVGSTKRRLRVPVRLGAGVLLAHSLLASCSPSSPADPELIVGQIRVSAVTTGSGIPASFSVRLDGGAPSSLAPDGSTTFGSLAPGSYEVELTVAANCTVPAGATRTVSVQEGVTTQVSYSVTCTATPTGAIGVTTRTTGSPVDPDGYSLSVDGGAGRPIAINATQLLADLPVGGHDVGLSGVADNCLVQDDNPRTVTVSQNQTTQLQFDVVCSATTGLIEVTVTTTGAEPDPDGYSVDLDGASSQAIAVNGSTTFTGVEEGDHTLTLFDLAPNCTVTGGATLPVTVVAGATIDADFAVECVATAGGLTVHASTTGSEIDPNGYAVSVDGGPEQALTVNGSTSFPTLLPGAHDVELTGVSGNCAIGGSNPRSVDVVAGVTASTTFDVTCSSTVGSIEVTVATTGDAIDADGYSVVLDGGVSTQLVDANDVATFNGIAPGGHSISLQNIAGNCSVTGPNPAAATVVAGATANVAFAVECEQLTGTIQVNMSTTGSDPDTNGYFVSLDGAAALGVNSNGSRTFSDVVIGSHDIEITGVATNCAVGGANPRTVTVNENATTQVDFSVGCSATSGQIHVTVTTTGDELDPNGYTVNLDAGAALQAVATNGSTTFTGVLPGAHSLTLQNFAANCSVTSPQPANTTVTAGATSNVAISVDCDRTVGDIRVFASSSGTPVDANGYTVSVDGGLGQPLMINGSHLFVDLSPGNHSVTISDVAPQCSVSGATMRTVSVTADQETQETFTVTCAPLTGDIRVNLTTTGPEPDPDGYNVLLDGLSSMDVGINGTVTFADVVTGGHSMTLAGFAANCMPAVNPLPATVVANLTTDVDFEVNCAATTGTIDVDVTTTGDDIDDDGYTVTLDGGSGMAIGVNASTSFTGVAPGSRDVELTGIAGNCAVAPNPVTVNVTPGNTENAGFAVTCSGLTGSVEVTTVTTGDDPDTDGFTVTIAGGTPLAIGNNDVQTFAGIDDGDQTLLLGGIAGNCAPAGLNPRTVTVPADGTVQTTFTVNCTSTTGDLRVTANSTGMDLDTGYTVTVTGQVGPVALGANGDTVTVADLPPDDYEVVLGDVADNCSVAGGTTDTVTVSQAATTTKAFDVTCVELTGWVEARTSTGGSDPDLDGYDFAIDGGGTMPIGSVDTVVVGGVAEGSRTVTLSGYASNCAVVGGDAKPASVVAGDTVVVEFPVLCVPIVGAIEVATTTTGASPDPDGYTVEVDAMQLFPAANDTVTFAAVAGGLKTVTLSGNDGSCVVTSGNPVMTSVTHGDTAMVSFTIDCP